MVLPSVLLVAGCSGGSAAPTDSLSASPPASSPPASSPATPASPSPSALGAHFENASVSIDYPADWRQQDQESGPLFLYPGGGAVVGIQVARWPKTLAKLVKPAEDVERGGFDTFELDGTADATLDGNPAIELTFHGALKDGTTFRAFAIWSVTGGRAYRFGFKAHTDEFDDLLPIAQAMMASFRIL